MNVTLGFVQIATLVKGLKELTLSFIKEMSLYEGSHGRVLSKDM